jgi:PIN domain nuclease of toxin-antitoxin system
MTTFLDATALIQFFADRGAAEEVAEVLAHGPCAATSVNLAEAAYTTAREEEISIADMRSFADARMAGLVAVSGVDEDDAWRAAELRGQYYHARRSALSLADCVLLAAAQAGDTIVTADHALATAARAEGIEVVGLPDARGRRP